MATRKFPMFPSVEEDWDEYAEYLADLYSHEEPDPASVADPDSLAAVDAFFDQHEDEEAA